MFQKIVTCLSTIKTQKQTVMIMKEGVSEKGFVENFYFCLAPGRFFPPERNEVGGVSGEIAGAQISQ
jgi:hypothetical protein